MPSKLDERSALRCGLQLSNAIERIQRRHGWTDGDTAAVALGAFTELLGRKLGPTLTIEVLQNHSKALAEDHARRSTL